MMDLVITTSEELNESEIIKELNELSERLGVEVNLTKY